MLVFLLVVNYMIRILVIFIEIKELREKMKCKFIGSNEIYGIKVGFKLPDGTKAEFLFSKKAVVKVS